MISIPAGTCARKAGRAGPDLLSLLQNNFTFNDTRFGQRIVGGQPPTAPTIPQGVKRDWFTTGSGKRHSTTRPPPRFLATGKSMIVAAIGAVGSCPVGVGFHPDYVTSINRDHHPGEVIPGTHGIAVGNKSHGFLLAEFRIGFAYRKGFNTSDHIGLRRRAQERNRRADCKCLPGAIRHATAYRRFGTGVKPFRLRPKSGGPKRHPQGVLGRRKIRCHLHVREIEAVADLVEKVSRPVFRQQVCHLHPWRLEPLPQAVFIFESVQTTHLRTTPLRISRMVSRDERIRNHGQKRRGLILGRSFFPFLRRHLAIAHPVVDLHPGRK